MPIKRYKYMGFIIDLLKNKAHVSEAGGMRKKYHRLVSIIMDIDPKTKIFQEKATSLLLGVSGMSGSTTFFLVQTFGQLTIQYRLDSIVFGKHQLEWTFDENLSQDRMYECMNKDIETLARKIMLNM